MKRFTSFTVIAASTAAGALAGSAAETNVNLPVSEIVLYSSGVGYFERSGQVEGRANVDLRFKTEEINDLLKSMVVQDLDGGRVTTVTYGSRDPLTKTLQSFGLDLTSNPTLADLLNQARGEKVEVLRPNPLIGTILGVEKKTTAVGDNKTVETEFLNLVTADGLQSVRLQEVQRIKLLDSRLNSELEQALAVLASGHDTQKKTVTISFDGEGKRRVGIAYIAQTPVWKTSYRLVLSEKEAPYLQGWAIVENTSDDDWQNVQLSLVSGRPISFVMDLYQPLYTTRPTVQPELYSSLRPQVYGDSLERRLAEGAAAAEPQVALNGTFGAGFGGGGNRFAGRGVDATTGAPLPAAPRGEQLEERLARRKVAGLAADITMAQRRDSFEFQTAAASLAQGTQTGELFQYSIKTPVSLARQKSAMLPIVSQSVEGQKVSIYNPNVQPKYPLVGFRLKNTTQLHLMQGPITVFEGGAYAGDAQIEDLAAGQDRLLSYALDIKTEVEAKSTNGPQELLAVKIRKGTLVATRRATEEKTYTVRNRDQKKKTVLIEHPYRADWSLVEPKEPAERTRDVYRFRLEVDPDKTASVAVHEEKQLSETVQLVSSAPDVIAYYLRSKKVSPKVKEALEKAVTLRDALSKTKNERERREARVNEISQEQGRIRENMAKLSQSSELYGRYVRKLDQQENELEELRKTVESLRATEARQETELNNYLLNLDVA